MNGSAFRGGSEAAPSGVHIVVDGANVVGSRPDGWWRDRPGAARRLAGQLVAALRTDPSGLALALLGARGPREVGAVELTVHLVLEGAAARATDLPSHPRLEVVLAPADGDSTIAGLVADLRGDPSSDDAVLVVTADRELRARVRAAGAETVGPGALLGRAAGAETVGPGALLGALPG